MLKKDSIFRNDVLRLKTVLYYCFMINLTTQIIKWSRDNCMYSFAVAIVVTPRLYVILIQSTRK